MSIAKYVHHSAQRKKVRVNKNEKNNSLAGSSDFLGYIICTRENFVVLFLMSYNRKSISCVL